MLRNRRKHLNSVKMTEGQTQIQWSDFQIIEQMLQVWLRDARMNLVWFNNSWQWKLDWTW
jgi:hypothetical protein